MTSNPPDAHARLIDRLTMMAELPESARSALAALPVSLATLSKDEDLSRPGDHVSRCCFVLAGLLYSYKLLPEGKRQIVGFHIPGDLPDLQSIHLGAADYTIGAVVASEVAFIPHEAVRDLLHQHPAVAVAVWREMMISASYLREWVVNLGARSASQRIAHLICEFFVRFASAGLVEEESFAMPLTQGQIGETTGLTTVHVNRTLQQLRGRNLIATKGRTVQILDWNGLQRVGGFDPAYLHLGSADGREPEVSRRRA